MAVLIESFLKHWGPRLQSFEDTYQYLLATLEEEDLLDFLEDDKDVFEQMNTTALQQEQNNLVVAKKELLFDRDFVASPKDKGDDILAQEKEVEHAENFMKQFEDSGLKSLQPILCGLAANVYVPVYVT